MLLFVILHTEINFIDRIAIIVDDGIIMESELNEALENTITNFEETGERLPPREIIFSRVIEKLIMDEILLQKAEKFGVRISDQELNESLSRFAEQDGLSLQDFRKKIESEGKQFKDFREAIKTELILRRVQGGLVRPKIIISDQELMNYINSTEGQSLITIEYKINQILLKGDNNEENVNMAKNIIEEINNGLSSLKPQKNILLFLNQKTMAIWDGVQGLNSFIICRSLKQNGKKDIHGPIKSGAGTHIIQLEDIRGETIQTESQTLVQHVLIQESEIRSEKQAEDLINELYERLSNGEELNILARVYSDDPGSKLDGGKLDWAPKGIYDEKFEEVMSKMEINEFSKPFKSAFGWHILKVLDRREKNISNDLLKDKA